MSRKKSTAPAPPAFVPRPAWNLETGEGWEAFARTLGYSGKPGVHEFKGTRSVLADNIAAMRAAATQALAEPDRYNTHQPARVVLGRLTALEAAVVDASDDVVRLVLDALLAGQAFVEMRVNAALSPTVNQVRARNKGTAERAQSKPMHDETHILAVLARRLSVAEEMMALPASRRTVYSYRKKYGRPKSRR